MQKFDDRIERLNNAFKNLLNNKQNLIERTNLRPFYIRNILEKKQENLNNLMLRLQGVSVESVLKRGFAWVKDDNGKTIYTLEQAKQTSEFEIRFWDGKLKTSNQPAITPPQNTTKRNAKTRKNDELQTDLFNF